MADPQRRTSPTEGASSQHTGQVDAEVTILTQTCPDCNGEFLLATDDSSSVLGVGHQQTCPTWRTTAANHGVPLDGTLVHEYEEVTVIEAGVAT
jgi:hypothetical protein